MSYSNIENSPHSNNVEASQLMFQLGVKPDTRNPITSGKNNYTDLNSSRNNVKTEQDATNKTNKVITEKGSKAKQTTSRKLAFRAKFAMGLAGAALSAFAICKVIVTFSLIGAGVAAGAAAAATPIGWAALGLVAVGLGILAARHLYLKHNNMKTDTASQLFKSGVAAVCGFGSVVAAAIALWLIIEGVNIFGNSGSSTIPHGNGGIDAGQVATNVAMLSLATSGPGSSGNATQSKSTKGSQTIN